MEELQRSARTARIGLVAGPVVFVFLLLIWRADAMGVVGSLTAWMAIWWMTEAIPIPATSLLPLVLLPTAAGQTFQLNAVAMNYANWRVYLFFGGFLIAIAMERTGLHRRIALRLVRWVGTSPRRLVFGFMLATAFLSMWISNTATALMMLPIGLAVISELPGRPRFAVALMLGIAYGATIGGVSTLVGTPPNITFLGELKLMFPKSPEVTFARWLGFALPLTLVFLPLAWLVLVRRVEREKGADASAIEAEIARLGPLRKSERRVFCVFVATALLWIFRGDIGLGFATIPGWIRLLPHKAVNDGVVAMAMGLSLFLVRGEEGPILDWDTVKAKMPWGLLLLFGGGFALAYSIRTSGLAAEVGRQFGFLAGAHPIFLISACAGGVTFLTEVTSNTATAEILLPLVGGIAAGPAGADPRVMMLPVTLAASCAFMLPVATPPNAVVFGSGYVRMNDMVRHGLIINLIGILLVTAVCYLLGPVMFGIDLAGGVPDWATTPVRR